MKSMSNSLCGFYETSNIQLTFFKKKIIFLLSVKADQNKRYVIINRSMAFLFNSVMVEFIRKDFLTNI